ncbi:GlcG/HbpS family heme-binding protein [Eubacterium aggregans]
MTQTGKLLDLAKKFAVATEKKAIEINVPMVISVCDMSGIPVYVERMEDSILCSVQIAQDKAWTAAALKGTSAGIADAAKEAGPLFGIGNNCGGHIVTFCGGFPLKDGDKFIGAIGISGDSVEEDESCCRAGLEAIGQTECL